MSLDHLFFPHSVAVVGASRNPEGLGHRILAGLVRAEFNGPVFPVNPNASHVASIRAYPDLAAIGAQVDLAVIAVPSPAVMPVIDQCIEVGVKAIVLVSAGFAEVGSDGKTREKALVDKVRSHGMRMVGPNCLGIIHAHPDVRLNASFAPNMPPSGTVALMSQSGALGVAIIALARTQGLGMSAFVSVGNKADVSGNDLLEYWEDDPSTAVILLYLESFGNPSRFARIARRVARTKPIVAVKAGRTAAGSRAATSHTAALSAGDSAVEAMFWQTGVIRADNLEEMFGLARALTDQPIPPGDRVAVVTNAGGPAILCVDALEAAGLDIVELSADTRMRMRRFLPANASLSNPVDMLAGAGPDQYRRTVEAVLAAEEVDAMVVIFTPSGVHDPEEVGMAVAAGVAAARTGAGAGKPVYASIVGAEVVGPRFAGTAAGRIPIYPFPEEIGHVLAKVSRYAAWRRTPVGQFPAFEDQRLDVAGEVVRTALDEHGRGWLSAEHAWEVLGACGIVSAEGAIARDAVEAMRIAARIGFPVAVKLVSRAITHKTDMGGVILDLNSTDEVRDAFVTVRRRVIDAGDPNAMDGVMVQPMLHGAEVMIGVDRDPGMGSLIAFGLGGIHVEILRDVAFRVAPLADRDAREMVRQIRGYTLLRGYRGAPAADTDALEQALLRVSRLVEAVPEIREIDLNPVFALAPGEGYRVVDARIRVG